MKSKTSKILLGVVVLGLVFAGMAPALAAEAGGKTKPVRLIVSWGNLDGYVPELASSTIDYKGSIEATTGKTQLRVVRPYFYELREDGYIQRSGKKIDFDSNIHGHKDGLIISVGKYDPIKGARLSIVLGGGDAKGVFILELRDLMTSDREFTVALPIDGHEQKVKVRALDQVSFGLEPVSLIRPETAPENTSQPIALPQPTVEPVEEVAGPEMPVPVEEVAGPEIEIAPEPVYLLVRWGNLDGEQPTDTPETINFNGSIEMITGEGQLRLARTYHYEFGEDGFIQRTGQKIETISRIHGHKDGVIIRVGNYDRDNTNWLKFAFGGDINAIYMLKLEDLVDQRSSKHDLKVDGKDYGQSFEVMVLN